MGLQEQPSSSNFQLPSTTHAAPLSAPRPHPVAAPCPHLRPHLAHLPPHLWGILSLQLARAPSEVGVSPTRCRHCKRGALVHAARDGLSAVRDRATVPPAAWEGDERASGSASQETWTRAHSRRPPHHRDGRPPARITPEGVTVVPTLAAARTGQAHTSRSFAVVFVFVFVFALASLSCGVVRERRRASRHRRRSAGQPRVGGACGRRRTARCAPRLHRCFGRLHGRRSAGRCLPCAGRR